MEHFKVHYFSLLVHFILITVLVLLGCCILLVVPNDMDGAGKDVRKIHAVSCP